MRYNYNTNKNGHDIESHCFYDYDLARMYYEENIESIKDGIAFFHGQGESHESIDWTIKGTKKEIVKYLWIERPEWYSNKTELTQQNKTQCIEDILEDIAQNFDLSLESLEEIQKHGFNVSDAWNRDPDKIRSYNLEIIPIYKNKPITLDYIVSRGYYQGDYCKVYFVYEFLESAWGKKPRESDLQEHIDNLLWDSPIHARVEIDGVEYYYYDIPSAETYTYDHDSWIAYLHKESGISVEDL